MTVNLTRIYTRLGDGGETHLGDMSRVPKTHPRVEAYGTVDELNAQLGLVLTLDHLPDGWAEWLRRVQNDLFDVGADVSVPAGAQGDRERGGQGRAQRRDREGTDDEHRVRVRVGQRGVGTRQGQRAGARRRRGGGERRRRERLAHPQRRLAAAAGALGPPGGGSP